MTTELEKIDWATGSDTVAVLVAQRCGNCMGKGRVSKPPDHWLYRCPVCDGRGYKIIPVSKEEARRLLGL